ncbi:unnamed protein product [Hydatigera taeniaeformis]|uniref:HYPK_UBA domain-containing protein n=1 Tax=Hydatigena taeniaeformis TaxID=6205 RepID=A0A0R3X3H7_HYDTA|nr:unnamed protein product [Hydatigera taeniaeformis]
MPRRSSNKSDSPVPRRQSARIAAASANKTPTPSPVKKTRRSSKRASGSKVENAEDRVDHNGTEIIYKDASLPEPVEKKQKLDGETTDLSGKQVGSAQESGKKEELSPKDCEASKVDFEAAREAGFEVVEKSSVPQSDSEEVRSAISAQGEDGQLLVNYVQVSKDDVPAAVPENNTPTSGDKPPANGTDTVDLCKGDTVVIEPAGEQLTAVDPEQKTEEVAADKPPAAEGISQ